MQDKKTNIFEYGDYIYFNLSDVYENAKNKLNSKLRNVTVHFITVPIFIVAVFIVSYFKLSNWYTLLSLFLIMPIISFFNNKQFEVEDLYNFTKLQRVFRIKSYIYLDLFESSLFSISQDVLKLENILKNKEVLEHEIFVNYSLECVLKDDNINFSEFIEDITEEEFHRILEMVQ